MNLIKLTLASIIFVMSFTMQSNIAEADCPTGFNMTTKTITIGNCDYEVEICYSCGFTHPGDVLIGAFWQVNPNCTNSLTISQILDALYAHIYNYSFILSELCPYGIPCEEGWSEHEIHHWLCWKIQKINHLGEEILKYSPCDYDNACIEYTKMCYDWGTQTGHKETIGYSMQGSLNCTLEAWEITIPQQVGEVSECFINHTECE